jgi:hypothetical protein
MVVESCLLRRIKDPYEGELRDAIGNRVDLYSMSIFKASSRLMHLAREMYENVAHLETVEIPDDFFDRTFIRHLMLATAETRRENVLVHGLYENIPFTGSRLLDTMLTGIFTCTERWSISRT